MKALPGGDVLTELRPVAATGSSSDGARCAVRAWTSITVWWGRADGELIHVLIGRIRIKSPTPTCSAGDLATLIARGAVPFAQSPLPLVEDGDAVKVALCASRHRLGLSAHAPVIQPAVIAPVQ